MSGEHGESEYTNKATASNQEIPSKNGNKESLKLEKIIEFNHECDTSNCVPKQHIYTFLGHFQGQWFHPCPHVWQSFPWRIFLPNIQSKPHMAQWIHFLLPWRSHKISPQLPTTSGSCGDQNVSRNRCLSTCTKQTKPVKLTSPCTGMGISKSWMWDPFLPN